MTEKFDHARYLEHITLEYLNQTSEKMKRQFTPILLLFASYLIAQNNYSLQFDGVNDYVDCGIPSGYVFDDLTVMCWIKTTASPGTYHGVVTKDGFISDFSILAHHTNVGDITFGGDGLGQISGGQINDGIWHFVAGTRKGSTGTIKLYIDGELIVTGTGPTGIISNDEKLQFGRYHPSNPHHYEGQIDEISIWDIELSQSEIQFRMQFCPVGNETGLKGYWKLNEGAGSTTYDATSNNNDGTLMNGVSWNTDVPITCEDSGSQKYIQVDSASVYLRDVTGGIVLRTRNISKDTDKGFMKVIDVVAAIICDEGGKILIAKRKEGKVLAGKWEFPGGKVEHETPELALERELKEEFGINTTTQAFFDESTCDYGEYKIKLLVYASRYLSGEFTLIDHDEIHWVDKRDLLSYDLALADIPIARKINSIKE